MQHKRARRFLRQTLNTVDLRNHIAIIPTASLVQPFQVGKLSFRINLAVWKFELAYHSFYLLPFLAIQRGHFPSSHDRSYSPLSTVHLLISATSSYKDVRLSRDFTSVVLDTYYIDGHPLCFTVYRYN